MEPVPGRVTSLFWDNSKLHSHIHTHCTCIYTGKEIQALMKKQTGEPSSEEEEESLNMEDRPPKPDSSTAATASPRPPTPSMTHSKGMYLCEVYTSSVCICVYSPKGVFHSDGMVWPYASPLLRKLYVLTLQWFLTFKTPHCKHTV